MHHQTLSFTVRLARTPQDIQAACRVRAQSYGHHLPHLQTTMLEPDLLDNDRNTAVALCVDKASGAAIGSARFQSNAGGKLLIEHALTLPDAMKDDTRAEISRLSAVPGADPLVKLCLMKASYLYCVGRHIRWMVISARNEALIRQYRRLGVSDLYSDGRMVNLMHVGRMDHRILTFNVTTAERTWKEASHPLYTFIFDTVHPDIDLFTPEPALPPRPSRAGTPAVLPEWIRSGVGSVPLPAQRSSDSGVRVPVLAS